MIKRKQLVNPRTLLWLVFTMSIFYTLLPIFIDIGLVILICDNPFLYMTTPGNIANEVKELSEVDYFNELIKRRKALLTKYLEASKIYKQSNDPKDGETMQKYAKRHDHVDNLITEMVEEKGYLDPDTLPDSPGGSDEG